MSNYANNWPLSALSGSGSGSITLGSGLNSINTISLANISSDSGFRYQNDFNPNFRRYEMIDSNEDIISLSVTWKRLRDNRDNVPIYANSLLSADVYAAVKTSDRDRANQIRDYFSKKIMLWTLKEFKLSQYRQDLSELIHGDGKKITEKMLPIAFRLPEFYEYDIEFDKFKQDVTLELKHFNSGTQQKSSTLTPIKCFYKSNKRIKQFEYWFKDGYGNANMIGIEPKNPLKHIWDKLFDSERLQIEASYCPKKYDDLQYYQLINWKLS